MKYLCSVIAALLLTPISAQHAVENAKNNSQENWQVAHKNLPTTILSNDDALELGNGLVKARCERKGDGIRQQFFALRNGGWVLVAESFRPPHPFPKDGNKLFQSDAAAARWLVSEVLTSVEAATAADGMPILRLRGAQREASVEQTISLQSGCRNFGIEVSARIPGSPPKLDYLFSTFTFESDRTPDFVHTPTLKYTEFRWPGVGRDQVIGDRSFHAPALILQDAGLFAALVPDLTVINESRVVSPDARRQMKVSRNQFSVPIEPDKFTMPTALDLNASSGLTAKRILSFGLMDYVVSPHTRYLRSNDGAMTRTLAQSDVRYRFDLFVNADAPAQCGYQGITRFQWENYGHKVFVERPHLAMPFAEYLRVTTAANLKPLGAIHPPVDGVPDTGSFLSFDLQGQPVGGYGSPVPSMADMLSNSEFWNNVRDAVGMYEWGKRTNNLQFIDMAKRTINLALLAPQDARGMFPLNYRVSGKWVRSMFTAAPGKPSQLFSTVNEEGDTYDVVAMSRTAAHLLNYYQRCGQDPRILDYAIKYANGLLPLVNSEGAVPSYVSAINHIPYAPLARSAQDSTTLQFLSELFRLTKQPRYLEAARRIGDRLIREVLPRQLWTDLEHYYSCGAKPLNFAADTEQGQPARGNISTYWAADGFAALYRATRDKRYLDAGERCVDYLTFSQCCWDPHFIYTAFPFGGMTADNADTANFLDARQCEVVAPLAWYGRTLGRQDLLERAVAAARSSVVLINHPRHQGENNIYRHTNLYPVGLGPENIDHEGHPQSAMRTHPSWGEASGVFTGLAEALSQLGGAYVDMDQHLAVGVDGLRIDSAALSGQNIRLVVVASLAKLPQPWNQAYQTELRLVGLKPGKYQLLINDEPAVELTTEELNQCPLTVQPDGKVRAGQ
jgi:hypothetical protein